MLQKSARLALALVLSLSLCPMAAFADEDPASPGDAENGYITTQADEAPVIAAVSVNGSAVTVTGSYFGATQGASVAAVTTGGNAGGTPIASAVSSWSDSEVRLALAGQPSGIIAVTITVGSNSAQASAFVSAGDDVYEESLAKPVDLAAGAIPSSGILKGWGEYLYCLREAPSAAGLAFVRLERYGVETGEWEDLAALPEPLVYASACVWEGNFIVMGVASGEERVYMYNFELKDWVELDAGGVPLGAGIVNLDGYLRVVGGAGAGWVFSDDVYEFDTGSGLGERVATLATPAFCPQLAVNKGQIFVYSYGDTIAQYDGTSPAPRHLQVVAGDDAVSIDSALPSLSEATAPVGAPSRSVGFGSLAAAIDWLMLVGPAAADGSTDTFILDWDWESSTLLPYYRTASEAPVYGAAACIHGDRLYAEAASEVEPGRCIFRATEVMAPTVESGNRSVWRQGSSDLLTITFTPDYSRYYDGVIVDGVELYGDTEYYVTSGSTVVDLLPDFLSTLSTGEHEMTVYFDGYEDGPGAEVQATFTIEGPANVIPQDDSSLYGYRPARLAMTGDLFLIVPFVVLGLGAIGVGIYLARRRMRNNS